MTLKNPCCPKRTATFHRRHDQGLPCGAGFKNGLVCGVGIWKNWSPLLPGWGPNNGVDTGSGDAGPTTGIPGRRGAMWDPLANKSLSLSTCVICTQTTLHEMIHALHLNRRRRGERRTEESEKKVNVFESERERNVFFGPMGGWKTSCSIAQNRTELGPSTLTLPAQWTHDVVADVDNAFWQTCTSSVKLIELTDEGHVCQKAISIKKSLNVLSMSNFCRTVWLQM